MSNAKPTPAERAARSAAHLFDIHLPQLARTCGTERPLRVIVASVSSWSPRESFDVQRRFLRSSTIDASQRAAQRSRWEGESKALVDWAWWMLKDGAAPAEIQAVVTSEQVWPFMVVASSADDLVEPLTWMYAHAWVELRRGGEFDVAQYPVVIPGGLAVPGDFWTR